jgi:hypothetical protein
MRIGFQIAVVQFDAEAGRYLPFIRTIQKK